MEIVGGVASLVQLVETALGIAKTSKRLYKNYLNAPVASKDVEYQSLLLQSLIDDYTLLRPCLNFSKSNWEVVPLNTRLTAATALVQVSEALQQLRSALDSCEGGCTRTASRNR